MSQIDAKIGIMIKFGRPRDDKEERTITAGQLPNVFDGRQRVIIRPATSAWLRQKTPINVRAGAAFDQSGKTSQVYMKGIDS